MEIILPQIIQRHWYRYVTAEIFLPKIIVLLIKKQKLINIIHLIKQIHVQWIWVVWLIYQHQHLIHHFLHLLSENIDFNLNKTFILFLFHIVIELVQLFLELLCSWFRVHININNIGFNAPLLYQEDVSALYPSISLTINKQDCIYLLFLSMKPPIPFRIPLIEHVDNLWY